MEWSEEAIVLGTRRYGETSLIAEVMTERHGRHLGLVRGGRSRRMRPVLQPGNSIVVTWRARLDEHLGNFRAEPLAERSGRLVASRIGAFGLALAAAHLRLLPERDPHPRLYSSLAVVIEALERPLAAADMMARFELALLDELGFGLDLETCAATGSKDDLVYVSPRSGRAVSRAAGAAYAERLFVLPAFLTSRQPADHAALVAAYRLTGYFLDRHVYEPRGLAGPDARASFLNAIDGALRNAA
jgi:DNA repair protein RecO (recombination protein O)